MMSVDQERSFAVYRSSAGSGKTFALVLEYLKMVLKEPSSFRHILAITFTNKAANEMRERVMQALADLSRGNAREHGGSHLQILGILEKDTGYNPRELALRAGEALSLILHHYSEFSIGTIDSFAHRVVRAFAHDFGLPVSFSVELESEELLTTAVDLLLERAGTDEELTRVLVGFLESRMEEDKGWNIEGLLTGFASLLLDEEGAERISELSHLTLDDFRRISRQLNARVRETEKACRELGGEGLDLIRRKGIMAGSFFHGATGIPGYFRQLASGAVQKLTPNSWVMAAIEQDRWTSPKSTVVEKALIAEIQPALTELLNRCIAMKEKELQYFHLNRLLLKTIFPLAVLNEIGLIMDAFKKQQNLVHISEFNRLIAGIVLGEPVPFIYERLGERYSHVLIDEFQDTSRLQWLNLVPLMENALAGGSFNLVVGDGKQAIYRWRNGDVLQFTSLPLLPGRENSPLIRQREIPFRKHFTERRLEFNYRSSPVIVEFNNNFFTWLSGKLDERSGIVYRDLIQKTNPGLQGGFISLEFISSSSSGSTYADVTVDRTDSVIRELIATGYTYRDIAVLCRANREASLIARELILRGIPVVSSESLLLAFSPEVRFITEMIRCLTDPGNSISEASVIRYLHSSGMLPKETGGLHDLLSEIASQPSPGGSLFRILRRNGWNADGALWLTLPLYDLCETLIRTFALNRSPDPYLQFLLDAAITFSGQERYQTADFPDWWDLHRDHLSVVVSGEVDAVRVMTIHKAKGLEFRAVLYAFADDSASRMTRKFLWADLPPGDPSGLKTALLPAEKELLETPFAGLYLEEQESTMLDLVNLLYVAMTRPKEQLYVLTHSPSSDGKDLRSLPGIFSAFLDETGKWEEAKSVYEFGIRPVKQAERPKAGGADKGTLKLRAFPSNDWRESISIRRRAPGHWDIGDPSGPQDYGNRVHAILEGIRTADDLGKAMEQALLSGLIAMDERERILKTVSEVLTHPLLMRFFSNEVSVRTEPRILEADGNISRPDRVISDGEELVIIDYKTGSRSGSHLKQIERYGGLLQEIGYRKIRKLLVYLGEKVDVVEIS